MTELEINMVFAKEGPEIIKQSKQKAFQLIEQYADVYRDPKSTKEDLKEYANEAIRGLARVMDQYDDLNERLMSIGKYYLNASLMNNEKTIIH